MYVIIIFLKNGLLVDNNDNNNGRNCDLRL